MFTASLRHIQAGHLEGAQVHEEGLLTDAIASKFGATIRIAPQTAKRNADDHESPEKNR